MKSMWHEYKEEAIALRKTGLSMTVIERRLGIPRSTLSGWFKKITLTEKQKAKLKSNSHKGWDRARVKAAEWHRSQKALRLLDAKKEAAKTLEKIEISDSVLDLAFAMLYFGEGAKNGSTSIASSDPKILKFVLAVLKQNYKTTPDMVRCELHLRADQDKEEMKKYWSHALSIPLENFKGAYKDKRTSGRATYNHYKGVCVLYCGSISIQRKLINLYNLFCEKVDALEMGD